MKNTTICVTGGCGAIGISLVQFLLNQNPKKIIIIDNLSSGSLNYLPKDNRIQFYHIDISNKEKLQTVITPDIDYIFHLAAHFANQNSVEFPISDVQTNIIGTINLLELCKNINIKKFINCSSSCVYSNTQSHMRITDNLYPYETPYAINKLSTELYTKFYSEQFNVPTINIRIFNTYGPYEKGGKYRNVIPNFIEMALKNKTFTITGTGEETRDFTYCLDTCNLLYLAALSTSANGDSFNGGTGIPTKIIDLANIIIKLCNSNSKLEFVGRRKWDKVTDRLSDISKSRLELGYIPSHLDLQKNLTYIINWYKNIL